MEFCLSLLDMPSISQTEAARHSPSRCCVSYMLIEDEGLGRQSRFSSLILWDMWSYLTYCSKGHFKIWNRTNSTSCVERSSGEFYFLYRGVQGRKSCELEAFPVTPGGLLFAGFYQLMQICVVKKWPFGCDCIEKSKCSNS